MLQNIIGRILNKSKIGGVIMGHHGAPNAETYRITLRYGAKGQGCFSIYNRRAIGGLPVGCYFLPHCDWITLQNFPWKYFTMCDHGNYRGADTRREAIDIAMSSWNFCEECADLR